MNSGKRLIAASISLILIIIPSWSSQEQRPSGTAVIMVSIDGLMPDYVLEADKHRLKIPNLRRLIREGTYATGVSGVTPTVTYPSHTTLLTGVRPARHGIVNNTPFDPLGRNQGGWFWYTEDIKSPTLWDAAGSSGLVTANVDWPVSVGADVRHNIVQYWRTTSQEDHKLLRALSTKGLLDEGEKELGPYPAGYIYTLDSDRQRAKFISWMIEKKRPGFLTGYLSSLDEEQHNSAPYSAQTFETLEGIDGLIGEIRRAAERAYEGRYVLSLVSDHGHITTSRELHLNAALVQAGLIELDDGRKVKSWLAYAWNTGGSSAIMLKDKGDRETREKVSRLLNQMAAGLGSGIERVAEGEEISALGGFPEAAFIVGLKPGFRTGSGLTGTVLRVGRAGGTHGYLPGHRDMEASFFLVGSGVASNRNLGRIDMRDIAPTLAGIMKVALPAAEGKNLFADQ